MGVKVNVVEYCPNCTLPYEFCEFGAKDVWAKCVPHIRANAPGMYPDKIPPEDADAAAEGVGALEIGDKKAKGGEGDKGDKKLPGGKVKKKDKPAIVVEKSTRNKRKAITVVKGLDIFGVKLAEASKAFGKKFACGASVTKDASQKEQIDVQGDFALEIAEFIMEKFAKAHEISEAHITVIEDGKKHKLGE